MQVSPYCDECGTEVHEYDLPPGTPCPPDQATIQHVNSRIRYPGGRPAQGQLILMCWQCNQDDARQEREEVRREAQRQALVDIVIPPVRVSRPRRRRAL
jgi:hypothetical protein